ncbi:acetyl-CoA synthetase-like protein [Penicillium daleae]|uniref:Acetyl-CoA synthetase-like protein n=1 Tax=Penicillium daleae TaxID=63821 RepID=A0AAD6C3H6_9EURO|nr:acetyl-CoA synthetase-like protein [Penicillium daleae]KAJ5449567.1 acetyl-CoA synthetase-like protein [Penicillium daleae]
MNFDLPASNGPEPCEFPDKLRSEKPSLNVLSTDPVSALLPLSWLEAESAILSAWTVLLNSYYNHNPVSFLRFGGIGTHRSPIESGKPESISVDLQSEWNAVDLQGVLSEHVYSPSPSDQGTSDYSDRYAVWLVNQENLPAYECGEEIIHLEKASKACLLLVAKRTERDNVILNLYSHRERPCHFELSNLLDSLRKILDSLVYYPFKIVKDIEVISNYDRLRLREWMEVDPPKPENTIHGLVNRHYRERPAYIAISSTSGDVTYEELGKRSAAMAHKLLDYGVEAGGIVGFCLEKSALSLIVLLAILRAGAGYVPIATSNPVDRIEYITRKAEIQVLVVEGVFLERMKDHTGLHEVQIITASSLEELEVPSNGWTQELNMDPAQLVYIMFTSGSTGQPKGVVHKHGAVSGGLQAVVQRFGLSSSTRFLQFASFSFDASICELFAPWVAGGTVCIPSEEERIGDLEGVMHKLNVTDASLTPSIATFLKPQALPTLKHLYIGGEAPTAAILNIWADKVRLSNIYGLTEGGVWDTVELHLGSMDNPKTIGRGIGARCWIVDPGNIHRLQPIGVEGEVLLQSPYLAHKYLDDGAQSSKAFISLPESLSTLTEAFPARCYQTGDLARWQPNGRIIFTGRRAGFVKIRGLRVELGEIEMVILGCLSGCEQVAVVLAGDKNANNSLELVAFIEQKDERYSSLADQMTADLQKILPSYMVPSAFVSVQSMPLTESKKIHRQQLIADWASMTPSETMALRPGGTLSHTWSRIDPANSRAIEVSNIIADLVETKQPSSGESLRGWDFTLASVGLDSIRTAYLSGEIRRRLGVATQIQELQQPGITVCQIGQRLSRRASCESDGCPGASTPTNLLGELNLINVPMPIHAQKPKTIFATSITGFLGSQVLRVLLEDPRVGHIVGLVRSGSEEDARDKLRSHAELGQWWRDEFDTQIEVWLGDLSLPRLGLDDAHWADLTGRMRIHGIIHNGARVNWLDDFSMLKATNVNSTRTILEALSVMPKPCPFTYVSGGYLPSPTETPEQTLSNLANACGYDQTKFLSRMMVEKYNLQLEKGSNSSVPPARVVQPGYLAGTRWEGIAHPEDFLWRLAYSILSLRAVSDSLQKVHIPVAGVEQIASLVVESALNPNGEQVVDCHDGVSIGTLCRILSRRSGRIIKPMGHDEWMTALRLEVENNALDHPFLPVLHWLEANMGQFTRPPPVLRPTAFDQRDTIAALDKSSQYLLDIGFLPSGDGGCQLVDRRNIPRFQRSKCMGSAQRRR